MRLNYNLIQKNIKFIKYFKCKIIILCNENIQFIFILY